MGFNFGMEGIQVEPNGKDETLSRTLSKTIYFHIPDTQPQYGYGIPSITYSTLWLL